MVDATFAERRLAEIYDPLDPDRSDLDAYAAIVDEFSGTSVLDIGCGTGTLACLLAQRAREVTGIDPATASLAVARRKPGAERVRWLEGYAAVLPPLQVDMVTMTDRGCSRFRAQVGLSLTADLLASDRERASRVSKRRSCDSRFCDRGRRRVGALRRMAIAFHG